MFREFLTRNTRVPIKERVMICDKSLRADGFRITVTVSDRAEIKYYGERAREYAEETFACMTDHEGTVPVMELEDYPSFPLRGIVEGFYGTPYTYAQRRDAIDFLASHRMNAYFYAPKADPFHRDRWREPYPAEELKELAELNGYAKERHVRLYYCISPIDFHFADETDYARLAEKLRSLAAVGVRDFAVLFDDISPALSEEEKTKFSSPAEAHCEVVNFVNRTISHTHPIVFCPTDYFQNTDTPYRKAVREHLDVEVQVFWTGYNTVAEAIPERDCVAAKRSFSRELVLWDNYPVNDFRPKTRVYLGAVCNRTRNIANYHAGCVANPSALWETSKVALSSMAEWMWNAECYDEEGAYARAVKEQLGETEEARFFADLSRSSVLRRFPTRTSLFAMENWKKLDEIYTQQARVVENMRSAVRPALAAEWEPLFAYAAAEAELYFAMRKGEELEPILKRMEESPMRTEDQSLLRYIAEKELGRNIELPERAVYWNTERSE